MPNGELRGDQVDGALECAGQLPVCASDEAHGLPLVVSLGPVLDWPGRARLRDKLRAGEPGRSVFGSTDLFLSFLDGVGEGGRCGLKVTFRGRKSLHLAGMQPSSAGPRHG